MTHPPVVDTLLDGADLGPAEAAHVASCEACAADVRRARRFMGELSAAAVAVVEAPAPAVRVRARGPVLSRFAGSLAVVVALVVVAAVVLATLRPTAPQAGGRGGVGRLPDAVALEARLAPAGYTCEGAIRDSHGEVQIPPGMVCHRDQQAVRVFDAYVLDVTDDGAPERLLLKAGPSTQGQTPDAAALDRALADAAAFPFADPADRARAQRWQAAARAGGRCPCEESIGGLVLRLESPATDAWILTIESAARTPPG